MLYSDRSDWVYHSYNFHHAADFAVRLSKPLSFWTQPYWITNTLEARSVSTPNIRIVTVANNESLTPVQPHVLQPDPPQYLHHLVDGKPQFTPGMEVYPWPSDRPFEYV